jgi:hypothetical protein
VADPAATVSRAVRSVGRSIRLLAARLLRRDLYVLECRDVTEEFLAEPGERFYLVEYYYRGAVLRRIVKLGGELSADPTTRRLQEHCTERIARRPVDPEFGVKQESL